jgi:hypothetical protein
VRVPLPCLQWGNRLVGSYGDGWIATTSGYDRLIIANFFSGARMALRTNGIIDFHKIIFSEYPSSSGCIRAGITRSGCIALRRVGCAEGRWTYATDGYGFEDIIFSNGKLYGFAAFADTNLLCQFDIGVDKDGDPVTILVYSGHIVLTALRVAEVSSVVVKHIFELHGKLAIAVKIGYGRKTRHFFRLFKLVGEHTWAEVTNLRDHTLFLGPACCKAVHVSTAGRRGAVEGNRIYYLDQDSYNPDEVECLERLDIGSCTMHCCKSEGRHHLERILSRGCKFYGGNDAPIGSYRLRVYRR